MGKRVVYKAEEQGRYGGVMPEIVVMPPVVINESNPPEGESVSSEGLDAEQGVIFPVIDGVQNKV